MDQRVSRNLQQRRGHRRDAFERLLERVQDRVDDAAVFEDERDAARRAD
jgi:hypothetical protein